MVWYSKFLRTERYIGEGAEYAEADSPGTLRKYI